MDENEAPASDANPWLWLCPVTLHEEQVELCKAQRSLRKAQGQSAQGAGKSVQGSGNSWHKPTDGCHEHCNHLDGCHVCAGAKEAFILCLSASTAAQ